MLKLCGSERSERLLNDAHRSVYTRRVSLKNQVAVIGKKKSHARRGEGVWYRGGDCERAAEKKRAPRTFIYR